MDESMVGSKAAWMGVKTDDEREMTEVVSLDYQTAEQMAIRTDYRLVVRMVHLMAQILVATKAVPMVSPKAEVMAYHMVAKTVAKKVDY